MRVTKMVKSLGACVLGGALLTGCAHGPSSAGLEAIHRFEARSDVTSEAKLKDIQLLATVQTDTGPRHILRVKRVIEGMPCPRGSDEVAVIDASGHVCGTLHGLSAQSLVAIRGAQLVINSCAPIDLRGDGFVTRVRFVELPSDPQPDELQAGLPGVELDAFRLVAHFLGEEPEAELATVALRYNCVAHVGSTTLGSVRVDAVLIVEKSGAELGTSVLLISSGQLFGLVTGIRLGAELPALQVDGCLRLQRKILRLDQDGIQLPGSSVSLATLLSEQDPDPKGMFRS